MVAGRGLFHGERLRRLLMLSMGEHLGNPRTSTIARELGVSAGTVRRWIRDGIPKKRESDVAALVRPSTELLAQERKELEDAQRVAKSLDALDAGAGVPMWAAQSWLVPHRLVLFRHDAYGVIVPRVSVAESSAKARKHQLQGLARTANYARVVRAEWVFPSKYHAQVARLQLLEELLPYRVQLREGILDRGATQAWLSEARTPRLPWMRFYRVPRAGRGTIGELARSSSTLTAAEKRVLRNHDRRAARARQLELDAAVVMVGR